jgi:uncharacterized protein YbcI
MPATDSGESASRAAAISKAMTKLHRDHYGRGPDSVRTVVGYDHVICFLEDLYTTVERTLLERGEIEAVRQTRLAFQRAMEPTFVAAIEEVMGRKVRSFLSQVSFDPDVSVEIFILERDHQEPAPEGSPRPSKQHGRARYPTCGTRPIGR